MISSILKFIKFERLISLLMPIGSWYLKVSPRMITCREFNDFVFDYTEEALTDEQMVLFERHMIICPMCRNFLQTYQASFKSGRVFFPNSDENVPDTVPADLLDAIYNVYVNK